MADGMTSAWLRCRFIFLAFLPVAWSATCPMGCYCNKKFVDCSALMEFPTDLPLDTVRFRVSQLNAQEIPRHVFSYLPNITSIEIGSSNVGLVAKCAFTNLPSVKKIIFDKAVIGSIESFAFWDLKSLEQIDIKASRIGRVKPFAFYDIATVDSFSIVGTNLPIVYTHAFCNISDINSMRWVRNNISDVATSAFMHVENVTSVDITENTFWNLHCGVLDSLLTLGDTYTVDSNKFYCNCSIADIINNNGTAKYRDSLATSTCHGPESKKAQPIWQVPFGDIGCKNRDVTMTTTCKEKDMVPSLECAPGARPDIPDPSEENGDGSSVCAINRASIASVLVLSLIHLLAL